MKELHHALPGALAALLRDVPLSEGKVQFAWNAAVGPALQHATAIRLERTLLLVEAATPQWEREVSRASAVILARLQTLLGAGNVTSISVRPRYPDTRAHDGRRRTEPGK